jgi:hypothetical protein
MSILRVDYPSEGKRLCYVVVTDQTPVVVPARCAATIPAAPVEVQKKELEVIPTFNIFGDVRCPKCKEVIQCATISIRKGETIEKLCICGHRFLAQESY